MRESIHGRASSYMGTKLGSQSIAAPARDNLFMYKRRCTSLFFLISPLFGREETMLLGKVGKKKVAFSSENELHHLLLSFSSELASSTCTPEEIKNVRSLVRNLHLYSWGRS